MRAASKPSTARLADRHAFRLIRGDRHVRVRHAGLREIAPCHGRNRSCSCAGRAGRTGGGTFRIGDHGDRIRPRRGLDRGVDRMREPLEERQIRERREQHAREHDRLAADPVGERAEHDEERPADQQRAAEQQVRRAPGRRAATASGRRARRTGPCTRRPPARRSAPNSASTTSFAGSATAQNASRSGAFERLALGLHAREQRATRCTAGGSTSTRASRPTTPGTGCASPTSSKAPRRASERQREDHARATGSRPSVAVVWIQLV